MASTSCSSSVPRNGGPKTLPKVPVSNFKIGKRKQTRNRNHNSCHIISSAVPSINRNQQRNNNQNKLETLRREDEYLTISSARTEKRFSVFQFIENSQQCDLNIWKNPNLFGRQSLAKRDATASAADSRSVQLYKNKPTARRSCQRRLCQKKISKLEYI